MSSAAAIDHLNHGLGSVFCCPEESRFYAECLKTLVFTCHCDPTTVVEFGSGDGGPVIDSLRESRFKGLVHGFELDPTSCDIARANIRANRLQHRYRVAKASFFGHADACADCLIANPPYLPAPDRDIRLPLLYGGHDGSELTNALLSLGYGTALLMISSYSNPAGTIRHATGEGYGVSNFMIAPLTFGFYSREPKVKHRIETLRADGKAFYDGGMYLLAGALFTKRLGLAPDLSNVLIKILTSL